MSTGLPENWTLEKVEGLLEGGSPVVYGILQPGPDTVDGVPYIRPTEMSFDSFEVATLRRTTQSIADRYKRSSLAAGDVVLSIVGSIGKVSLIPSDLAGANITQSAARLRPRKGLVESRFLAWALKSPSLIAQYERHRFGNAVTRLNISHVRDLLVPLPPFPEQRRIVAKIDELFSDLDAGVAALERVRTKLKRYRASVLNAAVTGKLTEAWRQHNPPAEPAEKLLARILDERRKAWEAEQLRKFAEAGKTPSKGWEKKYSEARVTTVFSPLPTGWCWATVEQLTIRSEYGTSAKCSYDATHSPVLRIPNIAAGQIDLADMKFSTVSLELASGDELRRGDVLMCRTNGSISLIGKTAVIGSDLSPPHSFASYLLRFRFAEVETVPRWVHGYLSSVRGRHFIESHAASSAGQHNVSLSLIGGMSIPFPPLAEQDEIVAEVERRLSVVEAVEAEVELGLKRAARLRQAILKRAFEGKLVPQDPADRPVKLPSGDQQTTAAPKRQRGRMPRAPTTPRRKHRQGIAFDRGAVISRIVSRLHKHPSFGRTENMKAVYLAEAHVGVDLELEPVREHYGPLDSAIYKIENLARTKGWFTTRKIGGMIRYSPGPNIDDRLRAADRIVGDKMPELDRLLDKLGAMGTDQAELFATAFAVWNDLLLDSLPVDEQAIINGVHSWHPDKIAKFTPERIAKCLDWMRREQFVPKGTGPRSAVLAS